MIVGTTTTSVRHSTDQRGSKAEILATASSAAVSWRNDPELVRAAVRDKRNAAVRFDTLGFRVARTLGQ
jgi:formylglycine-generating enzyme required for sulfatase activity